MNLKEAIETRRSVRHFQNKPVAKYLIEQIVKAANFAPSACNIQGWKFIIVEKSELRERLYDQGGSIVIKNSPSGILVLYPNQTANYKYNDHLQSASAAIQNMLLTAHELGLGTCWICHLPPPRKIKKIFKIPKYFSPIAYIAIGYPERPAGAMPRRHSPEEIINTNEFSSDWEKERVSGANITFKKILTTFYHLAPLFIKKGLLNKFIDRNFVKKFDN